MSLDVSDVVSDILADNPNAVVMIVCAYGSEPGVEDEESESEEEMELETDSWFSEAFWDSILSNDMETVAGGGGGGGGSAAIDAILMDNPSQS